MRWTTMLLLLALAPFGCDKADGGAQSAASEEAAERAGEEPTSGAFAVTLKVSGTQAVFQAEVPKPDEVAAQITAELYKSDVFAADGPRKLEGTVMYDIQQLPDDAGMEVMLIGGLRSPNAKFDAGVNFQSSDEAWQGKSPTEIVGGATAEFAERIVAQARVIGGDDATLAKILTGDDEPLDARLMAIQEVRERRLPDLIPQVKPYLDEAHDPALRLAAAATLVSLGDTSARAEILQLAETFSRDRDPRIVPLLHILGDLGGDEVVMYLQTVADAHSAEAVRTVAGEALKKAQRGQ